MKDPEDPSAKNSAPDSEILNEAMESGIDHPLTEDNDLYNTKGPLTNRLNDSINR